MPKQVIYLSYSVHIKFDLPKGIDLNDEETWTYIDKWGTLIITNLKTGEKIELEGEIEEPDYKFSNDVDIYETDSDSEE
jgi:hypothetical protein